MSRAAAALSPPSPACDRLWSVHIENFVIGELARQPTWAQTRAQLFHYRTKEHVEVDAVLEAADGRLVGIEVKAAETVQRSDFAGLRHLQSRLGDRFHFGLVLDAGTTVASFGERLIAAPIDLLWQEWKDEWSAWGHRVAVAGCVPDARR